MIHQDEFWTNREGEILRLDDMEPGYCGRVHAFLMLRAEHLLIRTLGEMASGDGPNGDVANACFNREWMVLESYVGRAGEWLERQPLLVALERRSRGLRSRDICWCGWEVEPGASHGMCYPGM